MNSEVWELAAIVFSILAGVFGIVKYFTNSLKVELKEDIKDCKKTAGRAHSRLDIHLENHQ